MVLVCETSIRPMMLYAKFGWNWPSDSGEEDFSNSVNVFPLFLYYLSLEKGMALQLNKLENPTPKDALRQVWLKMARWFCGRKIFKFRQCIFAVSLLSPLEGWIRPFIWRNFNPPRMLCVTFGWNYGKSY